MANKRPTPNWTNLREALWHRAKGRCEVSGRPLNPDNWDAHHRRNKGMGGTSRPDTDGLGNLLALTPAVHNGGPGSVHAHRRWAEDCGWLLPKMTPVAAAVPVLRWVGPDRWEWFTLDDAGGALYVPDVSARPDRRRPHPREMDSYPLHPWPGSAGRA